MPRNIDYPRRMRRLLPLLAVALTLIGCAESVLVKSYPPGAKAYVDDQLIGSTPAFTQIERNQVSKPHSWRVESRDCETASGQLETGIGRGRIVGYFFTLGVLALFKGPDYYKTVDAVLVCGNAAAAPSNAQKLAQRLDTLRDLYKRKLITKEEYDSETQKAVGEYTMQPAE